MKNIRFYRLKKIKLWFKVRIMYFLSGGKCERCGGKLHMNALGFYNCGPCFTEISAKILGDEY